MNLDDFTVIRAKEEGGLDAGQGETSVVAIELQEPMVSVLAVGDLPVCLQDVAWHSSFEHLHVHLFQVPGVADDHTVQLATLLLA